MSLISLSTCWNSPRHTDGYEMLAEIAALGFEQVELSHGIRLSLVPGIIRGVEQGLVKVASTHNFCPLPPGVSSAAPNLFTPSSTDERVAVQWERYTRRSIEFARQVGARVVVAHLGGVEFGWWSPLRRVNALMHARHNEGTDDLGKLRAAALEALARVRARRKAHWEVVLRRLEPILELARANGIMIGAENREKIEELPLDAEFDELLARFGPDSGIAAWHDTGHAHLKSKMGLVDHDELLRRTGPRLAGFHVHDVAGFKDHRPPGTGEIDFDMIAGHMRPEQIAVLELHPRLNPTDVVDARRFLEKKLAHAR